MNGLPLRARVFDGMGVRMSGRGRGCLLGFGIRTFRRFCLRIGRICLSSLRCRLFCRCRGCRSEGGNLTRACKMLMGFVMRIEGAVCLQVILLTRTVCRAYLLCLAILDLSMGCFVILLIDKDVDRLATK